MGCKESNQTNKQQGSHGQGKSVKNEKNSKSGKSQGILIWVREIWNFVKSQGKVREFHDNNLSYFWMFIITV